MAAEAAATAAYREVLRVKVFKAIGIGIAIEVVAIGVFVAAASVEGTRWAALFGLLALPLLAFTFPEKPKRRRYRP